MKAVIAAVLSMLLVALVSSVALAQQGSGNNQRDPAYEQAIYDRLTQVNPAAVPLFKDATDALDRGDDQAAKQGYTQVLALVPDFSPVLRRLSYVDMDLKDTDSALAHSQRANDLEPNPENEAALASVLLTFNSPAKDQQAFELAQKAAAADPQSVFYQSVLVRASGATNQLAVNKMAAAKYLELAPDDPEAHYFYGLSAMFDNQWEKAESELLIAEKLGMPAAIVEKPLDSGIRLRAWVQRGIRWGEITLAVWLVAMGLLFLTGLALSRLTLASIARTAGMAKFEMSRGEKLVRRVYRLVIQVCGVYYYLSIPILMLIFLGLAAGLVYVILSSEVISIRFTLFVALAILFTLYSLIRCLFVRTQDREPGGHRLEESEAPYFWQLVREVARRIETRPVDAIYITTDTSISVLERGGMLQKMRGNGKRCLVVGLGVLEGMDQGQLRAILAHEYGHFVNRDTAGGGLANQVELSMLQMAKGLAGRGVAGWFNPAWLFVTNYHRVYLRIILGASRLQEILADRYAALCYGAENLKEGLTHVIRQDLAFDMQVNLEVNQAKTEHRGLQNLYQLPPLPAQDQIEVKFQEIMRRVTGPYESHPAPAERFSYIKGIATNAMFEEDHRPAGDLIPDLTRLQQEMTARIEKNLRSRHIL
jgi:Zn-dependent protease with chaperone function